ncbi:heterokaryon incompatibility protein 6, OR allele [Colletotrichum spaethianum]|uniref:Heterokaryon incompatibility protein 6, OR allele n=1 Tax=Colletotrichum spaethianum TaxID=700344 RepID=A0AA37UI95_9PEZI|nr:heterokaryon incompatibility protein 6, OR allele [Colletotrichum spaethianum]GKT47579.1 heterokaryon incompatibility protein 6, OR allele [Colletotrichum spaethianum]
MAGQMTRGEGPKRFTYSTSLDEHRIRLITIKSIPDGSSTTHEETPPDLVMKAYALSDRPLYAGLSYTWGPAEFDTEDAEEDRLISLNGEAFHVRPNLYDALLQLRETFPDAVFWIDAICINQKDLRERETQVGIMDIIYAGALQTIAWLGKGGPKITRAANILAIIAHTDDEAWGTLG